MSVVKNQKSLARFEYDFALDGGAIGVIPMRESITAIALGMRILNVYVVVEEALDSAGSPTITLGNTTSAAGYMADFYASVSSSAKGLMAGEVAGALVWDDTNDHNIMYAPLVADDFDVNLTVAVAALTAGKIAVYFELIAE